MSDDLDPIGIVGGVQERSFDAVDVIAKPIALLHEIEIVIDASAMPRGALIDRIDEERGSGWIETHLSRNRFRSAHRLAFPLGCVSRAHRAESPDCLQSPSRKECDLHRDRRIEAFDTYQTQIDTHQTRAPIRGRSRTISAS